MAELLPKINSPGELKALSLKELEKLAQEIREEIITTVAKTGGHLAPNLGVVELTLALHRVFSSPTDKLIWDVGHQSYIHKLITQRQEKFYTLRQHGGISGFPRPEESIHDAFGTGHASTSISAGIGMAVARDLEGQNHKVISIIGDGALTGGMALEALNHAGHLKKNLIVVLNDNEMSISPNVGGLANYFSRLRTDPMYYRNKEDLEQLIRKITPIGTTFLKVIDKMKDSLKYLIVPGIVFEELGFLYIGPVNGHNLKSLMETLTQAKSVNGPVLVHVITRKGKGYKPAEDNADKFHGIAPFNISSGKVNGTKTVPTFSEVFGETLCAEANKNEKIVAITAAMTGGTGLKKFFQQHPQRAFDVGIAEQHAVTMAAGLAKSGYKPVVAIYSTFLQRAYDQVLHDVCLQNLPVFFALDRAGLVGDDGPTHHGVFDIAFLRTMPNMVLMAAKDEGEFRDMILTALQHQGPCAVRYPRGSGLGVPPDNEPSLIPVGKAEVLREGADITIIAAGNSVNLAEQAAEALAANKTEATVINARFIKPLDAECILHYCKITGKVITVEEHVLAGGFGSAILELLNEHNAGEVIVERIGIPDCFVEHGQQDKLKAKYGLTAENIVKKAINMLAGKNTLPQ